VAPGDRARLGDHYAVGLVALVRSLAPASLAPTGAAIGVVNSVAFVVTLYSVVAIGFVRRWGRCGGAVAPVVRSALGQFPSTNIP
jgi:hypothetical protein